MTVIARWECPEHGATISTSRLEAPMRWCCEHHAWIDGRLVEYVPAERLERAVKERDVLRRALEEACGDAWTDGDAAIEQYLRRARVTLGGR